jgi:hypothetical protein
MTIGITTLEINTAMVTVKNATLGIPTLKAYAQFSMLMPRDTFKSIMVMVMAFLKRHRL